MHTRQIAVSCSPAIVHIPCLPQWFEQSNARIADASIPKSICVPAAGVGALGMPCTRLAVVQRV
jgi:hypothetical protein